MYFKFLHFGSYVGRKNGEDCQLAVKCLHVKEQNTHTELSVVL